MATKEELANQALGLGVELGEVVVVDGLSHAQIVGLVGELKGKKEAAAAKAETDVPDGEAPPEEAPPEAPEVEAGPERDKNGNKYYVEPGKAITTPAGVMSDNAEISPKVVALWGKDTLQAHVKAGVLYRGK